ncbi:hypothetical protein [Nocardia sp. NPDC004260]
MPEQPEDPPQRPHRPGLLGLTRDAITALTQLARRNLMADDWNLKCRTCDTVHLLDWRNGGDEIQQLIPHLRALANAVHAINIIEGQHYGMDFPTDLVRFAVQHHAHDLIAVDEYGTEYGYCGYQYDCSCCGQRPKCRKPRHHDGDCGPADPE